MKPPLYFLPGTMCTHDLWSAIAIQIKDRYTLNYLHINSQSTPEEIAYQLSHQLPGTPVTLIGFSLGGYICSLFSSLYPERVQQQLIISCSPCPLSEEETKQRSRTISWIQKNGYSGISRKKAASMIDPASDQEKIIRLIQKMDANFGKEGLLSLLKKTSIRKDLADDILRSKVPTTFYLSESDPIINSRWIHNLVRSDNNCKAIITSGKGHMLPLEKPEELISIIKKF